MIHSQVLLAEDMHVHADKFANTHKGDLCLLGFHDGQQLLSNDREHFNVDAVELIEAAPRPRLGQPREETAHHLCTVHVRCVHEYNIHNVCHIYVTAFATFFTFLHTCMYMSCTFVYTQECGK